MKDDEKTNQIENELAIQSGFVFAEARSQVLLSGQSVLQTEGARIYRVFPDGTKELVKEIESPTIVVPGTKITIR